MHIMLSRLFQPTEYGVVGFYLALLSVMFIIGLTVQYSTSRYVVEKKAEPLGAFYFLQLYVKRILRGLIVLLFLLLWVVELDSILVTSLLFLTIFLSHIVLCHKRGYLQGEKRFLSFSVSLYIESAFKLFFIFCTIWWIREPNLILSAILAGQLLSEYWTSKPAIIQYTYGYHYPKFLKDNYGVFYQQLFFHLIPAIDMITIHILHPSLSGEYAIYQKYAQILLFLGTSSLTFLFPFFVNKPTLTSLSQKSVLLIATLSGAILLVYQWILPLSIPFLFGQQYGKGDSLLGVVAASYLLFIFSQTIVQSRIAQRHSGSTQLFFMGLLLYFMILIISHSSMRSIIIAHLGLNLYIFIALLIQQFRKERLYETV
ncbi:hypothetical protein Q73_16565 [Bacillus coahuilensis m2-6]|nr:hypothetical protein Q73_16565 [Bacillus coahuilensis m2-6]